jgi:hypothetical protein
VALGHAEDGQEGAGVVRKKLLRVRHRVPLLARGRPAPDLGTFSKHLGNIQGLTDILSDCLPE